MLPEILRVSNCCTQLSCMQLHVLCPILATFCSTMGSANYPLIPCQVAYFIRASLLLHAGLCGFLHLPRNLSTPNSASVGSRDRWEPWLCSRTISTPSSRKVVFSPGCFAALRWPPGQTCGLRKISMHVLWPGSSGTQLLGGWILAWIWLPVISASR